MAQITKQPLLSLCIPIYNRLVYLERQLARMMEDKDLFEEQIQLIISDNCSSDDLKSCCEKYQQQGLRLKYHRNEINLGADGNFDWCFHHADGKYVWLLGSDDVPIKGLFRNLLSLLNNGDYGLVHLSMTPQKNEIIVFDNSEDMLVEMSYWITFMSANIIRTDSLQEVDISHYLKSLLIQVSAYLNACLSSDVNAISYWGYPFEKDCDASNNGGYNLFQVFVENLYDIYQSFVDKGMLSEHAFEKLKKKEYNDLLVGFIIDFLILKTKRSRNFDKTNAWAIIRKYYGRYPYAYYIGAKTLFYTVVGRLIHFIR